MNEYKTIQLPDFVFSQDLIRVAWGLDPFKKLSLSDEHYWFLIVMRLIDQWLNIEDTTLYITKTINLLKNIKVIFSTDLLSGKVIDSMLLQVENLSYLPENVIDDEFVAGLRRKYLYTGFSVREKDLIYVIIMNPGWLPLTTQSIYGTNITKVIQGC